MESLTPAGAAAQVVKKLVDHLKANPSVKAFFDDFTAATVDWIRPVFLKDGDEPTPVAAQLAAAPEDELNQTDAQTAIQRKVRELPDGEQRLAELLQSLAPGQTTYRIHNEGANIGQQNIDSQVDNRGANFKS